MDIAILGATSQIAKDLILSLSAHSEHNLTLFARSPESVRSWLISVNLVKYLSNVTDIDKFSTNVRYDALLNFVGVGNPAQAVLMGASIFDVTLKYDDLSLNYIRHHPECRYLFLSSGAAYGASFNEPVNQQSKAMVSVNDLQPQDSYAVAKLYAECRHRSLPDFSIIDIRVFNYFSCTQDMSARFFICDILRSIVDKSVLKTSSEFIVRDYLHPADFYQLVISLLSAPPTNAVVDCYSLAPISKPDLLLVMQEKFGLCYEFSDANTSVNATGSKPYYYSLNTRAADFGYQPTMTSLQGIEEEIRKILEKIAKDTD
jgi:nucleoside-diphosphate-sugar epimerase